MTKPFLSVCLIVAVLVLATPSVPGAPAAPAVLKLTMLGPARELGGNILGASSEPMIEHLIGNPTKLQALREVAPAVLRFPGGSQANFYDWRTGLLDFRAGPRSSAYIKFWANAAPKIAVAHPHGVHLKEFAPLAQEIDADVILVPNLETSTVAEQVAWFRQLASENLLPTQIELGNEFWIAMGNDPDSMKRWPDEPTAMKLMHRYEQALRPIVGPRAKFAVQSAASAFWVDPNARALFLRRQLDWDAALKPEEWFEAVTIHLYPGLARLSQLPGGETHEGLFHYMMARCDAGTDRVIAQLARRLPGKEIWITEWSPRGGGGPNPHIYLLTTPAMLAQGAARMTLAFLRHPEVTRALFFTLNFDAKNYEQFVHASDGSYRPLPAAQILAWFNHAARSGAIFQRVIERGAVPVAGGRATNETYLQIEGGVFKRAGQTTLILQNAGTTDRVYDPRDGGRLPAPQSIEILATPDLNDEQNRAAVVRTVPTSAPLTMPALSVVRVIWAGNVAVVP